MLIILHGDDTATSRKYFLEQKHAKSDGISLDGEKITITDLTQALEGGELFADTKDVFIENLLSKRKKSAERDALIELIQQQATEHNILLWEGRELERSVSSSFKTATFKLYKLPQTLFAFLESLRPDNGKMAIPLFHKTLATQEAEMIFFMMVRQIRLLLALTPIPRSSSSPFIKEGGEDSAPTSIGDIDEIKRIAPWQQGKLQKQASLFGEERLKQIYKNLFAIEVAQKTGTLSSPMVATIDFFLLGI